MTKQHSFLPISRDRIGTVDANYELQVVQQPQQARATGRSKRFTGRRTIDPPPVIQVSLVHYGKEVVGASDGQQNEATNENASANNSNREDVEMATDDGYQASNANSNTNNSIANSYGSDANDNAVKPNEFGAYNTTPQITSTAAFNNAREEDEQMQEDDDDGGGDSGDNKVVLSNIIHHTLNPLILVASIISADAAPSANDIEHCEHRSIPSAANSNGNTNSHSNGSKNDDLANTNNGSIVEGFGERSNSGIDTNVNGQGVESRNLRNDIIKEENTEKSSSTIDNNDNNPSHNSLESNNDQQKKNANAIPEFDNLVGTTSVVANMVSDKTLGSASSMKAVFVFSNLSVKQDGNYKLRFTLYEFAGFNSLYNYNTFQPPPNVANCVIERGTIDSAVFKVYTAKKFPGLTTSSKLSFDLKSSGTKIKVRHSIRSGKKSQQEKDESSGNKNEKLAISRTGLFGRATGHVSRANKAAAAAAAAAAALEASNENSSDTDNASPVSGMKKSRNSKDGQHFVNSSYLSPNVHYNNMVNSNSNNGIDMNDAGSINSFATNNSNDYYSMTPIFPTMSTSSTSSLQSAAHSFGSFFSFRQPEFSPLKLLSDVSSQQLPISIMNSQGQKEDSIIPSPPGSPKLESATSTNNASAISNNSSSLNINRMPSSGSSSIHHLTNKSSSFSINTGESHLYNSNNSNNNSANSSSSFMKSHKLNHSNNSNNLHLNTGYNNGSSTYGHHHSNSHSSRYDHQSQDSLSSIHTRQSNLSISTPTSLYFSTPSSHIKTLVNKRSDQHLNKDEEEEKLAPQKKSKPDRSNQYKAAIMKIQNIIN